MAKETQTYKKLKPAFKKRWLKALRSGKYKQCTGFLKLIKKSKGHQPVSRFCCLGVAQDILYANPWKKLYSVDRDAIRDGVEVPCLSNNGDDACLSDEVCKRMGLDTRAQAPLTILNDSQGKSFKAIANWIEKNL